MLVLCSVKANFLLVTTFLCSEPAERNSEQNVTGEDEHEDGEIIDVSLSTVHTDVDSLVRDARAEIGIQGGAGSTGNAETGRKRPGTENFELLSLSGPGQVGGPTCQINFSLH